LISVPRQLSEELHASLRDRTKAFRTHIQAIRTDNLGAPLAFHEALQLVDLYTRMLEQHIERKCRDDQTEVDRVRSLKQVLSDLTSKEEDVDKLFARGGQSSIPRSMSRRIQDEFHALDLRDDPRPVLTIGPPGNFEVQIMDFRAHLFGDLWHAEYQAEAEYRRGNFALISVPYLEGTRAFWEPLVLGHEVGHFQVHYRNNRSNDEPVGSGDHYLDSILHGLELQSDRKSRSWLQEFLCDLNAYRLYGPAAISAVGEMLAVAGGPGNEASDVHPPRSTRLLLLKQVAELQGDTNTRLFSRITSSWIELAEEELVFSVPPQPLEYLSVFLDNVESLWKAVEAWGATYEYSQREQIRHHDPSQPR
jgi:hypothetical protein